MCDVIYFRLHLQQSSCPDPWDNGEADTTCHQILGTWSSNCILSAVIYILRSCAAHLEMVSTCSRRTCLVVVYSPNPRCWEQAGSKFLESAKDQFVISEGTQRSKNKHLIAADGLYSLWLSVTMICIAHGLVYVPPADKHMKLASQVYFLPAKLYSQFRNVRSPSFSA